MQVAPLADVRVLDFSWVIAGPLCTQTLAQLGAEVIRVETARRAEYRAASSYYHALGHGKRSLTLNMGDARGRAIAARLATVCDVVVENFSSGVLERMGLGYAALQRLRPDIILCSSSGLGRRGPRSGYLAYGSLLQIYTGWAGLMGFANQPEVTVGGAWVDAITALSQVFAVQAALAYRDRTGEGQVIDLSMAEAAIALMPEPLLDYAFNGRLAEPVGNADPVAAPHGVYPCAGGDRWVAISVTDDAAWQGLQRAVGCPAWAAAPELGDAYGRLRYASEIDRRVADWTQTQSEQELFQRLQTLGVAAAPLLSFSEVMTDAQARARGVFTRVAPEGGREEPAVSLPWADERGWRGDVRPVPPLGRDTRSILRDLLGLGEAEIATLRAADVLS